MDTVDRKTRSKIMKSVPQKNTKPEVLLRKALYSMGFRYRLHDKKLPGSPDIVFPKYRAVIFIHGCFWHRHDCKYSTTPDDNESFWKEKFEANRLRDERKTAELRRMGWRVLVVWTCELKKAYQEWLFDRVRSWLHVSSNEEQE